MFTEVSRRVFRVILEVILLTMGLVFLSGIFVGLFGVVEVECSVRGGFFVVGVERFFCSCSVGDGLFSVLFCYLGWWAVGFFVRVNLGVIELGVVGYF